MSDQKKIETTHRFLDESGDTTFWKKGKIPGIGTEGISKSFSLGMVHIKEDLQSVRHRIVTLQNKVETDSYLNSIPSVKKKINRGRFYFHAKDDPPEVRERMFRFIKSLDCSFEMWVGRKIPSLFLNKHNSKETEFYADLLSHLLKNKLQLEQRLVLTIAQRGASTNRVNLELALKKAVERFSKKKDPNQIHSSVVFDVQNPRTEPLLCIPDYMCWTVQRVFERGETRHYNFIVDRIDLVVDLYDAEKYNGEWKNYYSGKNLLTERNLLGPPRS